MLEALRGSYRQWLVRWVDGAHRRALAVVSAALLMTVLALAFVAQSMSINTDTSDMLSPELEFRRLSGELSDAFPQFSDNLLVVIDGDTPDLADDAAMRLAVRLRQNPDVFGNVYDPGGDAFFRKNGLLFLDVDELADLGDRLAEAQPFLGVLWRNPGMVGLFDMLSLMIDENDKADGVALPIGKALESVAEIVEAQNAGKFAQLSWRNLMDADDDTGNAGGPYRRFIELQPRLDFSSLQPAETAMTAIRNLATELNIDADHGVGLRLTGSAALADEELASVERGMGLAGIVSLVLVLGLLAMGLRSVRLVAVTLATLLMGLVWTAAFALLALGELNLISVAFAVLFIGLSVDFGIHFVMRYMEDINNALPHSEALGHAASGVGGALSLSAIAAAIAFYSFLPTDYIGLAELGLIAGTGMFIALAANLTVLPALLTLVQVKPQSGTAAMTVKLPSASPRIVISIAVLLGIGAALLARDVHFDFDPMNLRDPGTESVSTILDMMKDSDTSPYNITVLADNLDGAVALGRKLETLPGVDGVRTIADYVPDGQDEKLEIISDLASFLSPSLAARTEPRKVENVERRVAFGRLFENLQRLTFSAKAGDAKKSASRLLTAFAAMADPSDSAALDELEHRLLASLPASIENLKLSLTAAAVDLQDLPQSIRAREITTDGGTRVVVTPFEDLTDRDALSRFVAAVRAIAPNATGSPVVIFEAGNTVVDAFQTAAVIAIVCIAALLFIIFGNLVQPLLVFAPLMLAAVLTLGASVLLDVPFNFANVIVLPLLFGLGVAGGIHLVMRRDRDGDVMATSTPRAIVYSALTTIGSFASIALSGHPGTASMGVLLTAALILTMAATLLVLPALMRLGGNT
ncbi:MAG: MMPL family transporter [Rhodospirillaceae bacterium]|jgi:uncharacterized protein|nr:MMPL family transporter [Rhodospirillaceae bacterium]MBT5309592.1 MMPL family transporter [Rhodospirillaceae bacterium]MBT7354922.1 MMPL family transporter [Rhodospirillaceae bacterium]